MTLDQLRPGQRAAVLAVGGSGARRRHLLEMGLTPGAEIMLQKAAPLGDPIQLTVRGYALTLRLDDARGIVRKPVTTGELPSFPNGAYPPPSANLSRRAHRCTLRSSAIKTAAKPRCSIS